MKNFRKGLTFKSADANGNVEAIIATLNVIDKDGDVTLPGFFGTQEMIMLPSHDWSHIPLGKGVLSEEGNQAIARLKMNLDIQVARDWHSHLQFDLKNGTPLQEWSYGFRTYPDGRSDGELEGRQVRFLRPRPDGSAGCKVDEVSPVVVGAGEGTGTLSVKSAAGKKFCDEADEVLAALKGLIVRAGSLAELRAKEGRSLSAENHTRLSVLLAEMEKTAPGLRALLVSEDDEQRAEARKLYLAHMVSNRRES